jgi:hypothetical protein
MVLVDIMVLQDSKTHQWEEWEDIIHLPPCTYILHKVDIHHITTHHLQECTLLDRLNKDILLQVPMEAWVNLTAVVWAAECTVKVICTKCHKEAPN